MSQSATINADTALLNAQPQRLALLRGLALGSILFIYTFLGVQARQPPTVLYLQGLLLLMLCCWWCWKIVARQGLPRSPLALPLLSVLGATTLATFLSIDRRMSMDGLLALLALTLFFFLICDLLLAGWHPDTFVNALLLLAGLLLVQGVFASIQWHLNWYQVSVAEYPIFPIPFRLFGVADHPNLMAGMLYTALPFAIMRLAAARSTIGKAGWALWLLAADLVLFFGRSRGGWIAALLVVGITVGWLILAATPRERSLLLRLRRTSHIWRPTLAYLALFAGLYFATRQPAVEGFTTNGGGLSGDRFMFWGMAWRDFLAHPLSGSGPLTYGRFFLNNWQFTRNWFPPHAHSFYFDTLAQLGFVGALALGWLLFVGARTLGKAVWHNAQNSPSDAAAGRLGLLVAACAGLSGWLAHSVFEVTVTHPINALIIMLLAALGLHLAGALRPGQPGLPRWAAAALIAPMILFVILARQSVAQDAMFDAIIRASDDDWAGATQAMDQATAADPNFAFYNGQRGYAYGMLAAPVSGPGNPAALVQALDSYTISLTTEPPHVPNMLNAAALFDQAGAPDQAERVLLRAQQQGLDWALPALLLGERYSAQGRRAEAEALFVAALKTETLARDMAACRISALCREVAERTPVELTPVQQAHNEAQDLLAQGQPQQALDVLARVSLRSSSPLPWLDRASAHSALGQIPQARYALRLANALGASDPALIASTSRTLAGLRLRQGNLRQAIADLERAALRRDSAPAYTFFGWRRVGMPGLFLPRLALLQRTPEDLAVFQQLAQLYAEDDRAEDAAWAQAQADALAALLGVAANG